MKAFAAVALTIGLLLGSAAMSSLNPLLFPTTKGGAALFTKKTSVAVTSMQATIQEVSRGSLILSEDLQVEGGRLVRVHYDAETLVLARKSATAQREPFTEARLLIAPREDILKVGERVRLYLWLTEKEEPPYAFLIMSSDLM